MRVLEDEKSSQLNAGIRGTLVVHTSTSPLIPWFLPEIHPLVSRECICHLLATKYPVLLYTLWLPFLLPQCFMVLLKKYIQASACFPQMKPKGYVLSFPILVQPGGQRSEPDWPLSYSIIRLKKWLGDIQSSGCVPVILFYPACYSGLCYPVLNKCLGS